MRVAIDSHLSWQQRQQRMSRWELPICRLLHERSSAPVLAWIFVPFAVLVALSRVVLGLHYPTDVLAGALLGSVLAWGSFLF